MNSSLRLTQSQLGLLSRKTRSAWRSIETHLRQLRQSIAIGNSKLLTVDAALSALRNCPMSPEEFAGAQSRLHNVQRHLQRGAIGAALNELSQLDGDLRGWAA